MSEVNELLQSLEEFKQDSKSAGYDFRLELAEMLIEGMKQRGWSQRELAKQTNTKPSFISRVINAEANCTLETAGKLLFALGIKAKLSKEQSTYSNIETQPTKLTYTGADDSGYQKEIKYRWQ